MYSATAGGLVDPERRNRRVGRHARGICVLGVVEVAGARPGREEQEKSRRLEGADAARLAGLEGHQHPRFAFELPARLRQAEPSGDDLHHRVLVQAMVAELVALVQVQNDRAAVRAGEEDARLALPVRCDRGKMPALHPRGR